jgi:hypothetical protein
LSLPLLPVAGVVVVVLPLLLFVADE